MALIHIGLHKTGTTSLQNIWAQNPCVSLSYQWLRKLSKVLIESIIKDSEFDFTQLGSDDLFYKRAIQEPEFQIFSNEVLSYPHILLNTYPDKLSLYFDALPQILHMVKPEANILLTVRSPASWVTSWYKSKIHIGEHRSYKKFILQEEDSITRHLNLDIQLSGWYKYFGEGRVHILPFELFRDNAEQFFQQLYHLTSHPNQRLPETQNYNPSQSDQELAFMRQFQRYGKLLLDGTVLDNNAKQIIAQQLPMLAKVLRKEMQEPNSKFQRVISRSNVESLSMSGLTASLKEKILKVYISYLKSHTGDLNGYLDNYVQDLE